MRPQKDQVNPLIKKQTSGSKLFHPAVYFGMSLGGCSSDGDFVREPFDV